MIRFNYLLFVLGWIVHLINGHGRLMEPPNRSSIWRFEEFAKYNPPINYNDNELFCGGVERQHEKNGGKCGICGDAYDLPQPRENEDGGKYSKGIIVRSYSAGEVMPISVELTTSHKGYFEFRLCAKDDVASHLSQECYDENLLELGDGSGTRFMVGEQSGFYNLSVFIPPQIRCDNCVLQWTYTAGNTWGDCGDGSEELGCGPQETFRGCSDVEVH